MVSDIMTLLSPERTLFVQELESKKRVFDTLAKLLSLKQTQLNQDQIFKVFATTSVDFSEVTWFYPSASSLQCASA